MAENQQHCPGCTCGEQQPTLGKFEATYSGSYAFTSSSGELLSGDGSARTIIADASIADRPCVEYKVANSDVEHYVAPGGIVTTESGARPTTTLPTEKRTS